MEKDFAIGKSRLRASTQAATKKLLHNEFDNWRVGEIDGFWYKQLQRNKQRKKNQAI